jgi:hypothetical protein
MGPSSPLGDKFTPGDHVHSKGRKTLTLVLSNSELPKHADRSVFCPGGQQVTPRVDGHAGQRGPVVVAVQLVGLVGQVRTLELGAVPELENVGTSSS